MNQGTQELKERWAAAWPEALALWSRFTKLREPLWCFTSEEAAASSLTDSVAMIRLNDHAIVISLDKILSLRLEDFPLEILGHEIGHHVFCPADLNDHARVIARMRRALPTKEHLAGLVANIYADLLINDRLQRGARLRMADLYKVIGAGSGDRFWTFYMRIYEVLWSLQKGALTTARIDSPLELDAQLGARLVRAYGKDWVKGAGRFAALCLTYLIQDDGRGVQQILKEWLDTKSAGIGGMPEGLIEIDPDEIRDAIHPSLDAELSGIDDLESDKDGGDKSGIDDPANKPGGSSRGQHREPFEYGEILKSLGLSLSPHDMAIRYYRERSLPHLVGFPYREMPESTEPLMEGLDVWDIGAPLEDIDWFESAMLSDRIIPGVTTVQRTYGTSAGSLPERQPVDLDIYVDCSGSMPNPQTATSYLTLAGAIISLSALRMGSRVKATLWSGKHDFQTTGEFVRDEQTILKILTGYIGANTAFPIHLLRDTFTDRKPSDRAVYILVISDDGVDSMFANDEKGNSGWDVSRMAIEKARGGATMVLNLWQDWQQSKTLVRASEQGWSIHRVQDWNQLVEFARAFSKARYTV